MVISCVMLFTYSLWQNNIGDTGAHALAVGVPAQQQLTKVIVSGLC